MYLTARRLNVLQSSPMREVVFYPDDEAAFNFIGCDGNGVSFLPEGKDEYYLRNEQIAAKGYKWRALTAQEIVALEANGNRCSRWDLVLVEDPFDTSVIHNNLFAGLVRIGACRRGSLSYHDFIVPTGITNSRIYACDIGRTCAVHEVLCLSRYIIGDSAILCKIDEMVTTNHAKFGEGIIKEGEDESVRVCIDPVNEAGGRSILPFESMICADAYLWAMYRDDTALMKRLKEITQNSADAKRGWYGTVGDYSVIKSCQVIKDVKTGSGVYIKGANKLKNLTIKSSMGNTSQIGEGVELVNGIVGYGCHVFYGVKAVRFVLGDNSSLKYGARLINSMLGDNSTVSCCEVLNNLVFPFHEQHHNNSFLIASLVMGQSNMAAGATVGSNHNSRGNDGEIIAGRGFWPGLSSTLKHHCRFASFTLLTKGSYPAELNITLPFSMVLENRKLDHLEVMPAYWWMYNMYALERNSWKYKARDKRKAPVQYIESDYLAPDTVKEILEGMRLLELWTGKAWFKAKEERSAGNIDESRTSLPSDEECADKGRELLSSYPDEISSLFVLGEMMERAKRPVRILRPAEGWKAYREMLTFYGVKTIVEYLAKYGIRYEHFAAQCPHKISLNWVNMGGQLVPEEKVNTLRASIRRGIISSWQEIHAQYDAWQAEYPKDKVENAYAVLRIITRDEQVSAQRWNALLDEAKRIRIYIEEQVFFTKRKDYDNPYRMITYRNKDERDAVLGKLEDNPFIAAAKEETARFFAIADAAKI